MKKISLQHGYVFVQGRKFKIEFWTEYYWDLPYVSVYEVVKKKKRKSWFCKDFVTVDEEMCIGSGWTTSDRIAWAKYRIDEYLQEEKDRLIEQEKINRFVQGDTSVVL